MVPMKNPVFVMLLLMVACGTAMAQVTPPPLINYQGVLRDKATGLPFNSTVDLVFTFYPDPGSTGTDILRDSHAGVVVSGGLFSVQLGGGVVADGGGAGTYASMSDLFRDFSAVWMQIQVGSETLSPRVRLVGAAYAMNATHLEGKRAAEFIDTSGSQQTKTGGLQVGTLSATGIDVLSYIHDYGDMYVQNSLLTNGPINATGGIVLPSGSALRFTDGSAVPPGRTPQQIATLHWYAAADQTAFPVGSNPYGVAFDGSNIWVTHSIGGIVTKLRASDGAAVGNFGAGASPYGVAFDGSNIWVANYGTNVVTKLRASDGATLGSFPAGTGPYSVAFDGSSIWVPNFLSNNVTKLRASDGVNLGTYPVGNSPVGVAFDGSSIWVSNFQDNSVTKLRASDGANLGTFAVGASPEGVAFDGSNIWVSNYQDNSVTKLRAYDGANLGSFPVGSNPVAVVFDGSGIWVANLYSNNVTKLRASDGAILGTFPVGSNPFSVAFDGTNIWVVNQGSNTVSRL